jgi:L-aminopeptidase/D-esterase-like protein
VNACGSVIVGNGPHFWAGPFEEKGEFGGYGFPPSVPPAALIPTVKGGVGENTTIALVATDAALSKAQAKEFAVMAQDGLARAIYPAHTTLDGDTVFAAATGRRPLQVGGDDSTELGISAANVLARAVARAIFEATAIAGGPPSWHDCHS